MHRVLGGDEQRAASATAPESPCGGAVRVSLRNAQARMSDEIGSSCSSPSATRSTGIIGGVIAIL